jgi:hypothetical protein
MVAISQTVSMGYSNTQVTGQELVEGIGLASTECAVA